MSFLFFLLLYIRFSPFFNKVLHVKSVRMTLKPEFFFLILRKRQAVLYQQTQYYYVIHK